jgi:hypothetical protein
MLAARMNRARGGGAARWRARAAKTDGSLAIVSRFRRIRYRFVRRYPSARAQWRRPSGSQSFLVGGTNYWFTRSRNRG